MPRNRTVKLKTPGLTLKRKILGVWGLAPTATRKGSVLRHNLWDVIKKWPFTGKNGRFQLKNSILRYFERYFFTYRRQRQKFEAIVIPAWKHMFLRSIKTFGGIIILTHRRIFSFRGSAKSAFLG